jgi:hypothetical protein
MCAGRSLIFQVSVTHKEIIEHRCNAVRVCVSVSVCL